MSSTLYIPSTSFNWRTLLRWCAIGHIIVLVAMGVLLRDRLPLGLAVIAALGLGLLNFRSGLWGDLVLGLLFADIGIWTLSAALTNVVQGEEFLRLLTPALLAALSSAGFLAAVAVFVRQRNPNAGGCLARLIGLGAIAFFVLAVFTGFQAGRNGQTPVASPTALDLRTENMAFSATALTANAGEVTVVVDNQDLWWHTFTIKDLGVDLKLPSSSNRQISFPAAPGTYEYVCAIPGHDSLGMRGTLTVR